MQRLNKTHDQIGVLAQKKFFSIHDTVSKAIEHSNISTEELQRVIRVTQRYLLLKQNIRHKNTASRKLRGQIF